MDDIYPCECMSVHATFDEGGFGQLAVREVGPHVECNGRRPITEDPVPPVHRDVQRVSCVQEYERRRSEMNKMTERRPNKDEETT